MRGCLVHGSRSTSPWPRPKIAFSKRKLKLQGNFGRCIPSQVLGCEIDESKRFTRGEPRVVPLLSWGHLAFFYRFFLAKRGTVVGKQQYGSSFGLCGRAIRVSGPFLKCRFESRSMKSPYVLYEEKTARFSLFPTRRTHQGFIYP